MVDEGPVAREGKGGNETRRAVDAKLGDEEGGKDGVGMLKKMGVRV